MRKIACGKDRGVALEPPQRADDASGQHPGDERADGDRKRAEQDAPLEPNGDRRGFSRRRQSHGHHPWRKMRRGIAGKTHGAVAPLDDFAALSEAKMTRDILRSDMIAADPAGNLWKACDANPPVVDDPHHASGWKLVDPERFVDGVDHRPDDEDRLQLARGILDPAGNRKDRSENADLPRLADDQLLARQHLLKIVTVADVVTMAVGMADVLAV